MDYQEEVNGLWLLPLPLSKRETWNLALKYRDKLEEITLDELIDLKMAELFAWRQIKDPIIRRHYRTKRSIVRGVFGRRIFCLWGPRRSA